MSAAGKPMGRAVDRAETELRDLILSGDLGPGDRLGEVELAAVLGMSRTPVREALRRLSSQGLVDVRSNKGARVIAWSDAELEQMFVLRSLLEGQGAAATARRATDADVERLDEMARRMIDVALPFEHRDLPRLSELNAAFHATLIEIAGSSTLAAALSGLVHASVLTRTQHAMDEAAIHRSVHHHLEIVAAVRARDPDWAESVMHSHLLSARASLLGPRRRFPDGDPHDGRSGGTDRTEQEAR